MAPLESGFATFQSPSEQRETCSHGTHIDERKHESGLFRLQTGPQMKWKPPGPSLQVCRPPLASRPKSSSTSRSAAASLFRMITDVCPLGSFAAYAVALTPVACSFVENSVFNSVPPLNEPANLSPYATGSNT